ncbi:MAG: hypothetical protein U0835_18675 [Isosphaeraceae bacterium]
MARRSVELVQNLFVRSGRPRYDRAFSRLYSQRTEDDGGQRTELRARLPASPAAQHLRVGSLTLGGMALPEILQAEANAAAGTMAGA